MGQDIYAIIIRKLIYCILAPLWWILWHTWQDILSLRNEFIASWHPPNHASMHYSRTCMESTTLQSRQARWGDLANWNLDHESKLQIPTPPTMHVSSSSFNHLFFLGLKYILLDIIQYQRHDFFKRGPFFSQIYLLLPQKFRVW
jgi:hypothetical protein